MGHEALGDSERASKMSKRASTMGFGTAWRARARMHTGSGGAGGVDLNCNWPPLPGGQKPPRF